MTDLSSCISDLKKTLGAVAIGKNQENYNAKLTVKTLSQSILDEPTIEILLQNVFFVVRDCLFGL